MELKNISRVEIVKNGKGDHLLQIKFNNDQIVVIEIQFLKVKELEISENGLPSLVNLSLK